MLAPDTEFLVRWQALGPWLSMAAAQVSQLQGSFAARPHGKQVRKMSGQQFRLLLARTSASVPQQALLPPRQAESLQQLRLPHEGIGAQPQ